jgi:hypothetical protein
MVNPLFHIRQHPKICKQLIGLSLTQLEQLISEPPITQLEQLISEPPMPKPFIAGTMLTLGLLRSKAASVLTV